MFRYAYGPAEDCTLELRCGDYFREGLSTDLLVISAWDGFYEPEQGTMIAALERCGIIVKDLKRELDFTGSESIRAWVSQELDIADNQIKWPEGCATRFRRLAVIESPRKKETSAGDAIERAELPVFRRMFSLLALLPFHNISCRSVATPLLNAGQQKAQLPDLTPGLIEGIRIGFQNVPELKELVVFDHKKEAIDELTNTFQKHFGSTQETSELELSAEQRLYIKDLVGKLQTFARRRDTPEKVKTITQDIIEQLDNAEKKVNLTAIGISARKLIEYLVIKRTESLESKTTIYKRINFLEGSINPWTTNALHTVRIFGNWMGHYDYQHPQERDAPPLKITHHHLNLMLLALRCVVHERWWTKDRKPAPPIKTKRSADLRFTKP